MSETPPTLEQVRENLYSAVISDVLDAAGFRQQCLTTTPQLAPKTGINQLVGRCRTTLWEEIDFEDPEPYKIELEAVDDCRPDDVLIAAAQGSTRSGIWGELLSTASRNRGCAGVIVDGAVRDIAAMREMKFPVFANLVSPYDSFNRQRVISRDEPVEVGGVKIETGDLVFADEDGVVIVPQAVEAEILTAAWQKVHAENEVRDAIRDGLGAAAAFEKYGVL
ncbi:MAG: 4-hydroxy-4-methyl-2-oxoglutarate aldolase [Verrucomicrobiales bacterium]|jgi:4-hydroxy-4-methyl-2-oxoglutarate aldolase